MHVVAADIQAVKWPLLEGRDVGERSGHQLKRRFAQNKWLALQIRCLALFTLWIWLKPVSSPVISVALIRAPAVTVETRSICSERDEICAGIHV